MSHKDSVDYEPGVLRVLQTKSETKAFYNKLARVYDLLAERAEHPMREAGLKMLAPAPGESMLEIGFGTGHILVELAKAVGSAGKVFGIDISENMLSQATGALEREGLADRFLSSAVMPRIFPTGTPRWTESSCASRWSFSIRRRYRGCWLSAGGYCGQAGES